MREHLRRGDVASARAAYDQLQVASSDLTLALMEAYGESVPQELFVNASVALRREREWHEAKNQVFQHVIDGHPEAAHQSFGNAEATVQADPEATIGVAFAKWQLAIKAEGAIRLRLLQEAEEFCERVAGAAVADRIRAMAWSLLGSVRLSLGKPGAEVLDACERAVELDPQNQRYADLLAQSRAALA